MGKRLNEFIPGLKEGFKVYPDEVVGVGTPLAGGKVWFVDGDVSSGGAGGGWSDAYSTIQAAITAATSGDLILVAEKTITALGTDPSSYTEGIVVPNGKSSLSIVGVSRGLTQGGLPQIKGGSTTTDIILTLKSQGCLIANLGFNGAGTTGGGILLDSDGGTTKDAFGTTITGCHFKNCKGTTATNALTGGAIMWSANGGSWQSRITNNVFYKNVGDIVLKGTSVSVPQDVVINGNTFQGTADTVDCHIVMGGSGMLGVTIDSNTFADVLPALSSATTARYVKLIGTGIFSNNMFAGSYTTTGFGAAKVAAIIPTTVGIVHNYSDAGLIVREA